MNDTLSIYYILSYIQIHSLLRVSIFTSETPKDTAEGEITEMFARYLEQTIRREPAYWLWSHKRWKASREEWADIVEQEKERLKEKQKQ